MKEQQQQMSKVYELTGYILLYCERENNWLFHALIANIVRDE